jgi:hypothetical protein
LNAANVGGRKAAIGVLGQWWAEWLERDGAREMGARMGMEEAQVLDFEKAGGVFGLGVRKKLIICVCGDFVHIALHPGVHVGIAVEFAHEFSDRRGVKFLQATFDVLP